MIKLLWNLFPIILLLVSTTTAEAQARPGSSDKPGSSASKDINRPSGSLQTTTAGDIRPMNQKSSLFNEAWVYHIYLDNGTQLYVSYMLANFGTFMSPVGGARLSVLNFNGEYYQVARQYPLEEMSFSESNHKLRLHPGRDIWFEGALPDEHRVRYKTEKDGVSYDVDLNFSEIAKGQRWGDGNFKVDGEQINIQMHIPHAKVEGKVKINDTSKKVTGTAYMDQTYQTTITPRVLNSGFRYVNHDRDNWEIGYLLLPEESRSSSEIVGYGIRKTGNRVQLKKPQHMELGDNTDFKGGRVPSKLHIEYNPSGKSEVAVTEGLERLSFLSEVSGFRKRIARSYLRGEVIEYRGMGKLNDEKPAFLNFFRVE